MEQPNAEAMRRGLDRFVGEWTMTAGPPGGPPWPGVTRARFEWLEGGFLIGRWSLESPSAPEGAPTSGTLIVGYDVANGTYVELHADDRGVYRVYQMGLRDGVWTLWRDGAPFAQRFSGSFSSDGTTIAGRWELARDGKTWTTDFEVVYTRVA